MAPVLSPLLIRTELPCRKQLLFQSCDNGGVQTERTGESSDIPSNLSPTKVCFEKATAWSGTIVVIIFLCQLHPGSRLSSGGLLPSLKQWFVAQIPISSFLDLPA